jgi:hypothetical protein
MRYGRTSRTGTCGNEESITCRPESRRKGSNPSLSARIKSITYKEWMFVACTAVHPRLRITVWDVLDWLAAGKSEDQIIEDYPELEKDDFRAVYEYAARVGRRVAL